MSTKSNEFVVHQKSLGNDNLYSSSRRNEIISTIAETFEKITNSKLNFVSVDEERLRAYVTSKDQKKENPNFTLMKSNFKYIEDIIPNTKQEEVKNDQQDTPEDENQELNDKIPENNISEVEGKKNLGLKFNTTSNPFTGALIGGTAVAGVGAAAVGGSIAACLAFDSLFLMSVATGEVFAAGWGVVGGVFLGGLGLLVAIPTLLGFGAYKLYRINKEKKFKEFYENFEDDKKEVERDIRKNVIEKIDKYFTKALLINDDTIKLKIDDINNMVNDILKILIKEDDIRVESSIETIKKNDSSSQISDLLTKLYKQSKLVLKNFIKIRQELIKTILNSTEKDLKKTFEEGIAFFKERAFGPQQINEENEKKINEILEKIISKMKALLGEEKISIRFKEFNQKTFKNNFSLYLREKFNEKKDETLVEKNFIENCNDFIIEPIANSSKNWGILSFYMFFTNAIQNIGVKLKGENFNKNKEKIENSL